VQARIRIENYPVDVFIYSNTTHMVLGFLFGSD
jgi:hypothetical protein